MLRYIFSHADYGSITLDKENSAVNSDSFTSTFSRSEIYGSMLRSYTISDKFTGIGKTWLDTVYKTYGWNCEVVVNVEKYSQTNHTWVKLVEKGRVNWEGINQTDLSTEINIEDGEFQAKVMNRSEVEIDYYSLVTVDGDAIIDFEENDLLINLRGIGSDSGIRAIYPKRLFERIINNIGGLAGRFDSNLFQTLPFDGELATIFFTNGRYIRGYNDGALTISLKDAFEALSANRCLGMGFEKIDGVWKVIIDKRNYFWPQKVVCELSNINNIEYTTADEFMFNELIVGYPNYEKKENEYGQSEYNNKAIYSTPLTHFKKSKSILSNVRADGTTIERLRVLGQTNQTDDLDTANFLLDCWRNESGNLESRKLEGIVRNPSGIYAETELYTNLLLSPARMVNNNGNFLITGMQFDKDKYFKIQKNETPTRLNTWKTNDPADITDGADILISSIGLPFLTGRIVKFDCTFDIATVEAINNDPNGLFKYFDNIEKIHKFAWGKHIEVTPVHATHQFEGYEAIINDDIEKESLLLDETGEPIMLNNGSFIKLENQNMASSKVSQLNNLATIPDDAMFYISFNGEDWYQSGAQHKEALKVDIDGMQSALLLPDTETNIILGSFLDKTTLLILYELKRGDRYRSGIFTLVADTDDAPAVITESATVFIPNTFGENAGVTNIAADVASTQIRLKITTDASDAITSEIKYLITAI